MPTYSFKNTTTGEEFNLTMKMAEKDEYLNSNPEVKQIFKVFPGVVDPTITGHTRTSDGFNDLLKHMKKQHYGSTIETR